MPNPQIQQGSLNRLLTHITFASYPALNIGAQNMSKRFAVASFGGSPMTQIPTGTGVVNSPEPYVMGSFSLDILRTQALGGAWLNQMQLNSVLGTCVGYPDSAVFPSITLVNASLLGFDPGAWDGTDPVIRITVTGTYYVNSVLWG
jgi:hypothetical protein